MLDFSGCKFTGGSLEFSDNYLAGDLRFQNNIFSSDIAFNDLRFSTRAAFYFDKPIFPDSTSKRTRITFKRIRFNPTLTFFEDVRQETNLFENHRPIILFRQCYLKHVIFAKSDMSLFSFCDSFLFEEAHFISVYWIEQKEKLIKPFPLQYWRRMQIVEERLFDYAFYKCAGEVERKQFIEDFQIESLDSWWAIANLYMKMKAAADKGKNYHDACGLYFNEFEMKRRFFLSRGRDQKSSLLARLACKGKCFIYSCYKLFAGYGEKPVWALGWAVSFLIFFAALHILNGIKMPSDRVINYDLALRLPNFPSLCRDFIDVLLYSIYRIIPLNLMPYFGERFMPSAYGSVDIILTMANSIVLIIFVVFIGVGLKRHFRRF